VIQARVEQQVREEQVRRGQGIPPLYLASTFDNLHDPRPSRAVLSTCKHYATSAGQGTGMGLYLWSPTNGNGKSHLAAAILMRYGDGFFVNALELMDALKDSFGTGEACRTYREAQMAALLVLDDVGAHQGGEWAETRFYRLINERVNNLLPTVYTSNYSPEQLEARVGARTASRIVGSTAIVHVDGPDHRRLRRRDLT
jgi:DNA replication protein DnaC